MLPSACVQVLPALRSTKMSPGMASKTVSKGARESAQPMMAVWGAWQSMHCLIAKTLISSDENVKTAFKLDYLKKFIPGKARPKAAFRSPRLALLHQGSSHGRCDPARDGGAHGKALVALLEKSHGLCRSRGTRRARGADGQSLQRWW